MHTMWMPVKYGLRGENKISSTLQSIARRAFNSFKKESLKKKTFAIAIISTNSNAYPNTLLSKYIVLISISNSSTVCTFDISKDFFCVYVYKLMQAVVPMYMRFVLKEFKRHFILCMTTENIHSQFIHFMNLHVLLVYNAIS